MAAAAAQSFHIAMYPWFAFGHLIPYLHLSNKLAKKGHKISFLAPTNTQHKLQPFNHHPDLITFIPITLPHVHGLPSGAETTSDVPSSLGTLLATAMDRAEDAVEALIGELKVDVVFFDFAYWIPDMAKRLQIWSIFYNIISPATVGYTLSPESMHLGRQVDFIKPPRNFPNSSIKLQPHEARNFAARRVMEFGDRVLFHDRHFIGLSKADMICFRTCREIEGVYCDYLEDQFRKPILLSGPVIPEPPTSSLEENWNKWLSKFKEGSIVYCAFGTECILSRDQFQELVLGLEITGLPFLAALKPPMGLDSVKAALPENFEERTKERGIVYDGWVQQQLILQHPAVGCFITHCGSGSSSEALLSKCQLVLLPEVGDQVFRAKMMSGDLKVGVEICKGEEDGLFTRDSVSKAVRLVMDEDSSIGEEVRANHDKIRELLLKKDLESSYMDNFNKKLQELVG